MLRAIDFPKPYKFPPDEKCSFLKKKNKNKTKNKPKFKNQ